MRIAWLKHWALFSAPLLIILLAIWLGFNSEAEVAAFFKQHRAANPDIKLICKLLTDWSNPVFYVLYGGLLIHALRTNNIERKRYILILLGVQLIVAAASVHFLKQTIGRPRPGRGVFFNPLTTSGGYHALPSGHTTEIVGWSLPLALRKARPWLTALLALFVGAVGFTRIYLGWHHPTDVFFGWLLGSFGGFATVIIAETSLFRKTKKR
ncbi:Phosphoesterase PA-phosphatase related protein [Pseudodesulfovibrio profundus]|uniref:Phosphoesterase PA-phosphatase related protein n=1 Tax=Pseudodesulfovibrio profundus TaxID=57320 RepID=A0A2C8FAM3_9BACT|nr:phosphatase PAP2 family protein [Pseudodesulfovibrio profundus]MBC15594.1 PA-phosphatase [Desulfovibrio sp.]SOB59828.1 Phosphoesterase PA-phosphatase related protein [Pseudodesulfovibrio profundus]